MFRYQVYRLLCRLLPAAVAGAGVVHAVLVGLGIASIDGTKGVTGQVMVSILYAAIAGAVFLSAVRAIRGGEWRKSTERDLSWRPPHNDREREGLIVLVVVVLIGAGVAVVGFLGGLHVKVSSGAPIDVAPAAFWAAGGVLMLGGVVALLADTWRDEVAHRPRDEVAHVPRDSGPPPQDSITYLSLADFCDDDCDDCRARFKLFSSDESPGCGDR